jgi:hypothetical protein
MSAHSRSADVPGGRIHSARQTSLKHGSHRNGPSWVSTRWDEPSIHAPCRNRAHHHRPLAQTSFRQQELTATSSPPKPTSLFLPLSPTRPPPRPRNPTVWHLHLINSPLSAWELRHALKAVYRHRSAQPLFHCGMTSLGNGTPAHCPSYRTLPMESSPGDDAIARFACPRLRPRVQRRRLRKIPPRKRTPMHVTVAWTFPHRYRHVDWTTETKDVWPGFDKRSAVIRRLVPRRVFIPKFSYCLSRTRHMHSSIFFHFDRS